MGYYSDQFVAVSEETTWDTAVARTKFFRCKSGTSVKRNAPRRAHEILGFADPVRMINDPISAPVHLVLPGSYVGLGLLLKHTLGAVADSGSGPGYTHTFTCLDTAPPCTGGAGGSKPSLSVELHAALDSGTESFLASGVCMNSLSLSWDPSKDLDVVFDGTGGTMVQAAKSGSPTYADLDSYMIKPSQVAFTIDASAAAVKSFNLTLDNGYETAQSKFSSLTTVRQSYRARPRSVTGTIELEDWSKATYDKFVTQPATPVQIIMTCTGPTNYSFVLTLGKVVLEGDTPEPATGGLLPLALKFRSIYDASNTALKIVEGNTTATT